MDASSVLYTASLIHVYGHEKYKTKLVDFLSKNNCVFQWKDKTVTAILSNSGHPSHTSFKTKMQAESFYEFLVKTKRDATL